VAVPSRGAGASPAEIVRGLVDEVPVPLHVATRPAARPATREA
jgi:hypothetical protein